MQQATNILRKSIMLVVIDLIAYVVLYLVNALISKLVGPIEYGTYGLIINTLISMSALLMFGFDDSCDYFIPIYLSENKLGYLHGFLKFIFNIILYVGLPIIIIGLFFLFTSSFRDQNPVLIEFLKHLEVTHPAYLFLWALPFLALFYILTPILYCINKPSMAALLRGVLFPMMQLAFLLPIYFLLGHLTINHAIFAYTLAIVVIIGGQGYVLKKSFPKTTWQSPVQMEEKEWLGYSLPLFGTNILIACINTTIFVILRFLHNQQAYLGYFMALITVSGFFFNYISYTVLGMFDNHISPPWNNKNYPALQKIVNLATYVLTAYAVMVCLFLGIFGKYMLSKFGHSYVAIYPSLMIYTVASALNTATLVWTSLLELTENSGIALKSTFISYIILIIAVGFVSSMRLDFQYLAWAYAIYQISIFVINIYYLKKHVPEVSLIPVRL